MGSYLIATRPPPRVLRKRRFEPRSALNSSAFGGEGEIRTLGHGYLVGLRKAISIENDASTLITVATDSSSADSRTVPL